VDESEDAPRDPKDPQANATADEADDESTGFVQLERRDFSVYVADTAVAGAVAVTADDCGHCDTTEAAGSVDTTDASAASSANTATSAVAASSSASSLLVLRRPYQKATVITRFGGVTEDDLYVVELIPKIATAATAATATASTTPQAAAPTDVGALASSSSSTPPPPHSSSAPTSSTSPPPPPPYSPSSLYKIGKSKDFYARRADLALDFSEGYWVTPLLILKRCGDLELLLHRALQEYRREVPRHRNGREIGKSREVFDLAAWAGVGVGVGEEDDYGCCGDRAREAVQTCLVKLVEEILETRASSRQRVGGADGRGQGQVGGLAVVVDGEPSSKRRKVGAEDLDGDGIDETTTASMGDPSAIRLRLELEKQKTLQAEAEARKVVAESEAWKADAEAWKADAEARKVEARSRQLEHLTRLPEDLQRLLVTGSSQGLLA
jgi:hypothetical protein